MTNPLIDKFLKLQEVSTDNPFIEAKKQHITEISKERTKEYLNKAGQSFDKAKDDYDSAKETQSDHRASPKKKAEAKEKQTSAENTIGKRNSGIFKAKEKIKEEIEELDEISKERLGKYADKAVSDMGSSKYLSGVAGAKGDNANKADYNQIANKRKSGIKTAVKKLSGTAKVNAEEVEFTDAELAHFESIIANFEQ